MLGTSSVDAIDTLLLSRQTVLESLQCKLAKTQTRMKFYADKKCRAVTYNIGDLVYVKLRPYRQIFASGTHYNKLSKRFYGPYKIIDKFGSTTYKLEVPSSSKIHPVFHCSLLKPRKGPSTSSLDPLPPTALDNSPLVEPLAILDRKIDSSTNPPTELVLVQWIGLSPDDATWEPWAEIAATYHLEDKVTFKEGGNDNNVTVGRPKRVIHKPIRLNDYV